MKERGSGSSLTILRHHKLDPEIGDTHTNRNRTSCGRGKGGGGKMIVITTPTGRKDKKKRD